MLTQFAQLYPEGLIRYTQSTFLELVTDLEVHRIDFQGKISHRLRRGTRGPISFPRTHPLLQGLHVPLTTLMARATPHYLENAPALLRALQQELSLHSDTWYDFAYHRWTRCSQHLADHNVLPSLTRTGGIIVDGVPILVAQAIARICGHYGVETYFLEHFRASPTTSPFQLLLIGSNYVIAHDFSVSTLC